MKELLLLTLKNFSASQNEANVFNLKSINIKKRHNNWANGYANQIVRKGRSLGFTHASSQVR